MSFRLAIVSKVELWNLRNSFISVRLVDELHEIPISGAIIAQIFVCVVTRSTTAEFQHNDMMMRTNVQNGLRHEMALEMWIVSVHEKSERL